ncbi:MAG: hypothetical protein J6M43_09590 [Neisseriaceae bacterium]|nr:hypothetical protein [Neisseriaceae bacterium]
MAYNHTCCETEQSSVVATPSKAWQSPKNCRETIFRVAYQNNDNAKYYSGSLNR